MGGRRPPPEEEEEPDGLWANEKALED